MFAGAEVGGLELTGGNYTLASFMHCDMRKLTLQNARLEQVDFRDCNLRQCSFPGCDLNHSMFGGANLTETSFRGAKLEGVDFRHMNMKKTKIDLEQAILIAESFGAVL